MSSSVPFEKLLYEKPELNINPVKVWLGFPYTYMYGMSTLGYLSLFKELDVNPDVDATRVFADTDFGEIIDTPDMVGFSMIFENDFLGIFKILEKNNIAIKADQRKNEPLVFAGGPVLTSNPEPFAEFFDFIIIGDGENVLTQVAKKLKESNGLSRQEKLIKLASINGIYVPSLYKASYGDNFELKSFKSINGAVSDTVSKNRIECIETCLSTPVISDKAFYSGTFFIELVRGCPQKCKFCSASYMNLPTRYPSFEKIVETVEFGLKYTGQIMFIGALVAEHPDFDKVCDYLIKRRDEQEFRVEFSSLKSDKFNQKAAALLEKCGCKEISIGIESGSQKLRNSVNKKLSSSQIFSTVESYVECGIKKLNIYSLIGLPGETLEDVSELLYLANDLKYENPNLDINMIVSTFVPKPNTPLQWAKKEGLETLVEKIELLKKGFDQIEVNSTFTNPKRDYISTLISRGDRRLTPVIEYVYRQNGVLVSWQEAYKELSAEEISELPDLNWYVHREISKDQLLPWDFIDAGLGKDKLQKDLRNKIVQINPEKVKPAIL